MARARSKRGGAVSSAVARNQTPGGSSKSASVVVAILLFMAGVALWSEVKVLDGDTYKIATQKLDYVKATASSLLYGESSSSSYYSFTPYLRWLYQYQLPSERTTNGNPQLCGEAPAYTKFFQLNHKQRSSSEEDKTIYQTFFQQSNTVDRVFTYVELGAFNGIEESNTRFFDDCLGWEGVLIEANPSPWAQLIVNRPHSHRVSFAASCSVEESLANKTVAFHNRAFTNSAQADTKNAYNGEKTVDVPCGSLTPVLNDLLPDNGHVDFFSLDVEGAEPMVLEHIDFDTLDIHLMIVENVNQYCPLNGVCESRDQARAIMKENGYYRYEKVVTRSDLYIHPEAEQHLQKLMHVAPDDLGGNQDPRTTDTGASEPVSPVAPTVVQKDPEPVQDPKPPESEPVDSGSEMFTAYYRDLYKYQPMQPLDELATAAAKDECGDGPDYEDYFSQPKQKRSSSNEDKDIYNRFFKDLPVEESSKFKYVELGAFNGVEESNTRFFDLCLGWEGLLIEANPKPWGQLVENRPHSHRVSFAASCSMEEAAQNKTIGFHAVVWTNAAQEDTKNSYKGGETVDVPCGSLTPVLQDVLGGHVHFFSLDVEGAEPLVLEHIDFNLVFIEVLIVENWNTFCQQECETRTRARTILKEQGYKLFNNIISRSDLYIHPNSQFLEKVGNQ